jgi:hypothetical protein
MLNISPQVGKIVHSFQGVEYAFEPPDLFSLFSLMERMPETQWRLLYKTYLYEEHFINALSGRNLNCNRQDDSSIYSVKAAAEIEARLSRSMRKAEAEQAGENAVIAYKIPDVVPFLPRLLAYYPRTRIVMLRRDHAETLNSLHRMAWFTDENATRNLIWPFTVHKGMQVPFWVAEDDHDKWFGMTALDRCAYYYLRMLESIEQVTPRIDIDYQRLVDAPRETAEDLAGRLGLSFGPKTEEILAGVKPGPAERDRAILGRIDPDFAERIRGAEFLPPAALPACFGAAHAPL